MAVLPSDLGGQGGRGRSPADQLDPYPITGAAECDTLSCG